MVHVPSPFIIVIATMCLEAPLVYPDHQALSDKKTTSLVPNTTSQDVKPPHCDPEDTFCESVHEYPSRNNTGHHTNKTKVSPVLAAFRQGEEVQKGAETNQKEVPLLYPDQLASSDKKTLFLVPNTTSQDVKPPHCDPEDTFCESVHEYPSGNTRHHTKERKAIPVSSTFRQGEKVQYNKKDMPFHFPEEPSQDVKPLHCDPKETFCESVEGYPEDLALRLLQTHELPNGSFQYEKTNNLTQKVGLESDPDPICEIKMETKYPKVGKNEFEQEVFIINQERYYQGVEVETCQKNGGPCSALMQMNSYKCTCYQKYMNTKLFSFTKDKNITLEKFLFPSHCGAKLTRVKT